MNGRRPHALTTSTRRASSIGAHALVAARRGVYNAALEAAYSQAGVYVVDLRQAFLGHGFNYKDSTNPYYDATDPTLWLQYDCIHPNVAGHDAIRRLIWQRLFG